MRIIALYILVTGLAIYAWRDWFRSLCGLILLMAVIEHQDMPKSIMGIQGLNLWNVLFASVFLAWLSHRRREGLRWDMPRHLAVLLLLYLGVILVGLVRAASDMGHVRDYTIPQLLSEELINTIKWALPGFLLFDGCRDRQRLKLAFTSLITMFVLLAVQVVKRMPFSSALGGGGDRIHRIRLKICHGIGYSSCDLSVILGGTFWAIIAAMPLVKKKYWPILLLAAATTAFGQALTGGRAGYVAWAVTGMALCALRWRKYLPTAPIVVIALYFAFPATVERTLTGIAVEDSGGAQDTDSNLATSGRTRIWPYVIDKIEEAPVLGFGRIAMRRTGLYDFLEAQYPGSGFPHPHNSYLESLLDNGIIGTIPILLLHGLILFHAAKLFRDQQPWCSAVGGLAFALVLTQLVAGLSSQHFYPEESTLGMWTAAFLAMRVSYARSRVRSAASQHVTAHGANRSYRQQGMAIPRGVS